MLHHLQDRKRQQHLVEELQRRRKMRLLMSAFASWQSDAVLGQELKARADGLAELQQLRRLQHALSKYAARMHAGCHASMHTPSACNDMFCHHIQ